MDIRTQDILELEEHYSARRNIQNAARGYAATLVVLGTSAAILLVIFGVMNLIEPDAASIPSESSDREAIVVAAFVLLFIYLIWGLPAIVFNRISVMMLSLFRSMF